MLVRGRDRPQRILQKGSPSPWSSVTLLLPPPQRDCCSAQVLPPTLFVLYNVVFLPSTHPFTRVLHLLFITLPRGWLLFFSSTSFSSSLLFSLCAWRAADSRKGLEALSPSSLLKGLLVVLFRYFFLSFMCTITYFPPLLPTFSPRVLHQLIEGAVIVLPPSPRGWLVVFSSTSILSLFPPFFSLHHVSFPHTRVYLQFIEARCHHLHRQELSSGTPSLYSLPIVISYHLARILLSFTSHTRVYQREKRGILCGKAVFWC